MGEIRYRGMKILPCTHKVYILYLNNNLNYHYHLNDQELSLPFGLFPIHVNNKVLWVKQAPTINLSLSPMISSIYPPHSPTLSSKFLQLMIDLWLALPLRVVLVSYISVQVCSKKSCIYSELFKTKFIFLMKFNYINLGLTTSYN